jgi:hypothetical protein
VIARHVEAGEEVAQFLLAVGIGAGFGILGGVLVLAWARWFKPNQSQALTGTLMFVVAMVVCADLLRDDTGLITGLFIGAILINRPPHRIEPAGLAIQTAKLTRAWRERIATLSTFLIGILFIILSARVSPHQIGEVGWVSLAFIGVLVLVGRPLDVGLSTLGSALTMRERAFIAWMAPRGISRGDLVHVRPSASPRPGSAAGAEPIPITFIVIVATALIYGLSEARGARAGSRAQARVGCCCSAPPGRRAVGRALHDGADRARVDRQRQYARAAKADGLSVYKGNPPRMPVGMLIRTDELEYALVVGADEALNAMIATDLSEYFGRDRVFQLAPSDERTADFYTRAQVLFDDSASHDELLSRIKAGAEITVTEAPAAGKNGKDAGADRAATLPMFVHTPRKDLRILTAGDQPDLETGQELISLIEGEQHGS